MSFVSDILPDVDSIRGITGEFGLCGTTVTVRTRLWSGGQVGLGTSTDTDVLLRVGGQNPKCRRVTYKQTVAGGGRYQEGDYRIGPMTPDGGGTTFAMIAPPSVAGTEVYYILVGSDTPAEGMPCTAVGIEGDHPIHSYLVVRPTGAVL